MKKPGFEIQPRHDQWRKRHGVTARAKDVKLAARNAFTPKRSPSRKYWGLFLVGAKGVELIEMQEAPNMAMAVKIFNVWSGYDPSKIRRKPSRAEGTLFCQAV